MGEITGDTLNKNPSPSPPRPARGDEGNYWGYPEQKPPPPLRPGRGGGGCYFKAYAAGVGGEVRLSRQGQGAIF